MEKNKIFYYSLFLVLLLLCVSSLNSYAQSMRKYFKLEEAIENKDYEKIKKLLNKGTLLYPPPWKSWREYNPMHTATAKDFEAEMVKYIIDHGGRVDERNSFGMTPLMFAVQDKSLNMVKVLVDAGANVNAKNNKGETPLYIGRLSDNREKIAKYLIDKGANVNTSINVGFNNTTPFLYALSYPYSEETMYVFLNAGANVNDIDEDGYTALHWACRYNYSNQFIRRLIKDGSNVNAKSKNNVTPLHLAARSRSKEIVNMLLNAGANPDIKNYEGQTAADIAKAKGKKEVFALLQQCKEKPLYTLTLEDDNSSASWDETVRWIDEKMDNFDLSAYKDKFKADDFNIEEKEQKRNGSRYMEPSMYVFNIDSEKCVGLLFDFRVHDVLAITTDHWLGYFHSSATFLFSPNEISRIEVYSQKINIYCENIRVIYETRFLNIDDLKTEEQNIQRFGHINSNRNLNRYYPPYNNIPFTNNLYYFAHHYDGKYGFTDSSTDHNMNNIEIYFTNKDSAPRIARVFLHLARLAKIK